MEALKIALLGGGTVGSAFYNLVLERAEELSAFGVVPRFLGVLVRDPRKPRAIPQELLRAEPFDLLEADLVVEAMGGVEAPLRLVLPALEAGIPLITANKALLAEAWESLRPFAEEGLIYHEASVMAGTPALSFLETLRGSELLELHGILNGTTLYILQEMEKGRTYAEALLEAQRLGYAEADPTLDVEGIDAAHKLGSSWTPASPSPRWRPKASPASPQRSCKRPRPGGSGCASWRASSGKGGGGGRRWPQGAFPRTTPWRGPGETPSGSGPGLWERPSSRGLGRGAGPRRAGFSPTSSASSPGPRGTSLPPGRGPLWRREAPGRG